VKKRGVRHTYCFCCWLFCDEGIVFEASTCKIWSCVCFRYFCSNIFFVFLFFSVFFPQGWIRTIRRQKNVAFVNLYDGSSATDLQVVLAPQNVPALAAVGASVHVRGVMTPSKGKGQAMELAGDELSVIGACDSYPLQKKDHSDEFLRENGHLRGRTSAFAALMRIRHGSTQALMSFLNNQGFIQAKKKKKKVLLCK
jgi:hypothetical protein